MNKDQVENSNSKVVQEKTSRTTELKEIYECLNEIDNKIIRTYDVFCNNIFKDIDYYAISQHVPHWLLEAGNSPECGIKKITFEKLVQANNNYLTNKLLYNYDCEMLTAALQDRFSFISALIGKVYENISYSEDTPANKFTHATIHYSPMDQPLFSYFNSIFIYLNSSFDLITKIAYELKMINTINFNQYPRLKSKGILFGDRRNLNDELKNNTNTIFSFPPIIKKMQNIRDRIIHNGSWSFRSAVYSGFTEDGNMESCIFFPDFEEDGNFVSSLNRNNFYVKSEKLNIILPKLLMEALSLVGNSIDEINNLYHKEYYNNINDILTYKDEISNWTTSAMNIIMKENETDQ